MSRPSSGTRASSPSPSKIKVAEHTPPSSQPGSPVEREDVKMRDFFAQDQLPSDGVDDDAGKDATRLHDADTAETYDGKRLCAVFPAQHGVVCSA